MNRKFKFFASILLPLSLWAISFNASAFPKLQLTIAGGNYVGGTDETTYATSNSFSLIAVLTPGNGAKTSDITAMLADTYRISAAVTPKTTPPGFDLGSFTFNGTNVAVTGDMVYGVAPIDTVAGQTSDPGDLSDHGIFDTYFTEFDFQFSSLNEVAPFDAQTTTPSAPFTPTGTGAFYHVFPVDVTSLSAQSAIHFDLYNTNLCTNDKGQCNVVADVDVDDFAPFSHDAQSGPGGDEGGGTPPTGNPVPEPDAGILLGLGLMAIAVSRIRRKAIVAKI